jgi:hypothetical protein
VFCALKRNRLCIDLSVVAEPVVLILYGMAYPYDAGDPAAGRKA